jgi:hypothetical protein
MNPTNPWKNLASDAPFVVPADKVQVERFNGLNPDDAYRLRTHLPPLPFMGRPNAPVVLLGLNPGYAFFFLDPHYNGDAGQQWWHKRLSHLRKASKHAGAFSDEHLAKELLCIQYFPYRSKSYKSMQRLDSQQYGFDLVQAAMDRKALIILLRSRTLWIKAVPNLENYEHLIQLSNPLNPVLSPGQLKNGGWEKLVAALSKAQ